VRWSGPLILPKVPKRKPFSVVDNFPLGSPQGHLLTLRMIDALNRTFRINF